MLLTDAAKIVLGADQAFITSQWYLLYQDSHGWRRNLSLLCSRLMTHCSRLCIMHPRRNLITNLTTWFPTEDHVCLSLGPANPHTQIAQNHISALEKLIDAYAMIGEAMPRFNKLSDAFKDDPEFLQVMGHFYEDVLEFHRRAYKFFRRRGKPCTNRARCVLLNNLYMIISLEDGL